MTNTTPRWLSPWCLISIALLFPAVGTWLISRQTFELEFRTAKFFDNVDIVHVAATAGSFLAGCFLCLLLTRRTRVGLVVEDSAPARWPRRVNRIVRAGAIISFGLSLFGSIIWILFAFINGLEITTVFRALGGDSDSVFRIRELAGTIPGVTTATQFGMSGVICYAILDRSRRSRWLRLLFVATVGLALLRGILRAERLAFIEVAVPYLVVKIREWSSATSSRRLLKWFLRVGPFVGIAALYLFFTVAEAGRSYREKQAEGEERNVWSFGAIRLVAYYATSLNNGSAFFRQLPSGSLPYASLDFIWHFPGLFKNSEVAEYTGMSDDRVTEVLKFELNQEFTNPSGIFMYLHDWGLVGTILLAFGTGIVMQRLYFLFVNGKLTGSLWYPLLVLPILEISRIPYITSTRCFPSLLMLGTIWIATRSKSS